MIRLLILVFSLTIVTSFGAYGLCVTSSKANLRAKPSSRAAITWVVGKHMPLLEVGKKGSWYKVKDVDGVIHWVYKSLVSRNSNCLVVKATRANIRKGPGSRYPLADYPVANKYFAFERLDSEDAWMQIASSTGQGPFWIHESLVWRALRVMSIGF